MKKYEVKGKKHSYEEMKDRGFRSVPTEILLCLIGGGLSRSEIVLFLYIYSETYGWKEEIRHYKHKFSYDGISSYTGLKKKTIEHGLKRLEDRDIITRKRTGWKETEIKINLEQWGIWNIDALGLKNGVEYVMDENENHEQDEEDEGPKKDFIKSLDEI